MKSDLLLVFLYAMVCYLLRLISLSGDSTVVFDIIVVTE